MELAVEFFRMFLWVKPITEKIMPSNRTCDRIQIPELEFQHGLIETDLHIYVVIWDDDVTNVV